ncbi:MAG: hypothetical protein JSW41_03935 [Candidatus Aenigmatarchaeota archaeon]|nr:MAG: hypothetical protein JSW41_03935 [Candidatus Aenigmarchaeota archaeon]
MKKLLAVLLIGFGAIVVVTSEHLGVEFVGLLSVAIGSVIASIATEKKTEEEYPKDVGVG